MTSGRDLVGHIGGGRAGAGAVFERIGLGVADFAHEAERVFEIGVGLAGEADDEVAGEGDVGADGADAVEDAEIAVAAVAAVHGLQNSVGAGLDGQMQERHQFFDVAVRLQSGLLSCRWGGWSCSGCGGGRRFCRVRG